MYLMDFDEPRKMFRFLMRPFKNTNWYVYGFTTHFFFFFFVNGGDPLYPVSATGP